MAEAEQQVPDEKQWPPLKLDKACVLITGGSSGLGFAWAKLFAQAGSKVIITGRRKDALEKATGQLPGSAFYVGDVEDAKQRETLAATVIKEHPEVNIVFNNAGNQRRVAPKDNNDWALRQQEINLNLCAPMHLTQLLSPHFLKQPEAAIVNITSGLGYWPCPWASDYAATKAAIVHWTASIRYAYEGTNVRVVEIAPPSVQSNLGGSHDKGLDTDEFCGETFKQLAAGGLEIGYQFSAVLPVWGPKSADRKALRKFGLKSSKFEPWEPYQSQVAS